MAEILIPKWEDFQDIVRKADKDLIICSPYYSEEGVNNIFDHLRDKTSLVFCTRLSPSDWVNGISDPEALVYLLKLLEDDGHNVSLLIHQRLHAKAYIADKAVALIGSSNLTEGGFNRNFEMMVRLINRDAQKTWNIFEQEIRPSSRNIEVSQLNSWVDGHKKSIEKHIKTQQTREVTLADKLKKVQKDLDALLGYGQKHQEIDEPEYSSLEDFVKWLRKNKNLSGAETLLRRHENKDGQNLTGHFKQCFFAVVRFLTERPEMAQILAHECARLDPKDIYQPSSEVSDPWNEHVDNHAMDSGEGYSYSILRGILPPPLGGTREGGGGGSSTLKRMMPLVGKYIGRSA